MADNPDLVNQILTDYPQFAYLLNDPEVGPLLLEAVDPNKGFDAATFQAKLMNTNWWKNTSSSVRQWQTFAATDPATAAAQKQQWIAELNRVAVKFGVQLKPEDLNWWADFYQPQGIQPNDPRLAAELSRVYRTRTDLRIGAAGSPEGDVPATISQLKQIAAAYFRDLTQADYDSWATDIVAGYKTVQQFTSVISQQAKDRFPTYAAQIDAGVTPEQLFSDRRDAIARELEVDPSTIDLAHDPRWSKVLGVANGDGSQRPMTYSEAIDLARSQPEWAMTTGANTQAADLTSQILKMFGKVA